jgi:hypothetical protein
VDAGATAAVEAGAGDAGASAACAVVRPIGVLPIRSTPKKSYIDMTRVTIAMTGSRALVTTDLSTLLGCAFDGCEVFELHGAWLGGVRAPEWVTLPSSATGVGPTMSAIGVVRRGELLALTQGHHGAATMDSKQLPNELWLVNESGQVTTKLPSRPFTADTMTSTADGTLVAAVGQEHPWNDVATGSPAAEALRVLSVDDAGRLPEEVVYRTANAASSSAVVRGPRAPAIAAGASRAAVAYRVADEAWMAEVDRQTGRRLSPPRRFARGELGQAALAFDGDELHAVWARRAPGKPYALEHARWSKGLDADPVVEVIVEHTESAIAPTIAHAAGRWVIAWTEGDLARKGRILLGRSEASLGEAAAHPEVLSEPGVNARDPKVALATASQGGGWVVWSEFGASGMSLRHAPLSSCP